MRNLLNTNLGTGVGGIGGANGTGGPSDADLGRFLVGGGAMDLSILTGGRKVDLRCNMVLLASNVLAARKTSEDNVIADLAR
ncbi:MAG: hypothetical protein U1E65_04340 [Myxococcota bacterium]